MERKERKEIENAENIYSMRVSNRTKKLQLLMQCCSLLLPRNHNFFFVFSLSISLVQVIAFSFATNFDEL
jgi:hypothetical protein